MKLVQYDINKLIKKKRVRSNNLAILEEFMNSGLDCVKVEGFTNKNTKSCCNSLNLSIKRYGYKTIKSVTYGGEVFLVKKSELNKIG